MTVSKAWAWNKEDSPVWLFPCEESYYLAERWRQKGLHALLDVGSGLGRHAIYFAQQGFDVSAFDLSEEGVSHLRKWVAKENVIIDVKCADMLAFPYPDETFDCLLAFHVISHTDTEGIRRILAEIRRVLKPGGEFFLTLCSKETWSFWEAGYPRLDANTVVKTGGGPEDGIPHFYVSLEDIPKLFAELSLIRIRHTDDCWFEGKKQSSKHYFILGRKPPQ